MASDWLTRTSMERFMEKVELIPFHTCWEWIGAKHGSIGYGSFGYKGKVAKAHQVAYDLFKGSIPKGLHVLHACDNRMCVNPNHLFLGTHAQNMQDRNAKNRQARLHGSKNGNSKLTESAVLEIRKLKSLGAATKQLAEKYNVSKTNIKDIIKRSTWKKI